MTNIFIYIIEAQNGMAKIGCAAKPEVRLAAVRTHSPIPVRLVASWPGLAQTERDLHAVFAKHRNHQEWFRIEGEFAKFFGECFGRNRDRIEDWHEITYPDCIEKRKLAGQKRSVKLKAKWADPAFREAKAKWRKTLKRARNRREKQQAVAA